MGATKLSNADKAAMILISLGEELAASIVQELHPDEVKRIGAAMSRVGRMDQNSLDIVLQEFLGSLNAQTHKSVDGAEFAQRTIKRAFKSDLGQSLGEAVANSHVTLRSVERADAETLYQILCHEHPQTMALVLAHMGAEKGRNFVRLLPESMRTEILMRMSQLDPVAPAMLRELDDHLAEEIEKVGFSEKRKVGGPKQVAEILNLLDREGQDVLNNIDSRNHNLADEIRQLMFTFDDLVMVDSRGVQELLRLVARPKLALALRGASDPVKVFFFRNMSERSAKGLRDDMEALGPQRLGDVQKAQREVIDIVRKLEEAGKLFIERGEKQVV